MVTYHKVAHCYIVKIASKFLNVADIAMEACWISFYGDITADTGHLIRSVLFAGWIPFCQSTARLTPTRKSSSSSSCRLAAMMVVGGRCA